MTAGIKPGARFHSPVCDVEVIVIKAPAAEMDLRCGGQDLLPIGTEPAEQLKAEPGYDGGTLIGKRYTDESGELELLCTKGGTSSLSLGDTLLKVKEPQPLPSSD